jgi:hypothetical protein
MKYLLNHKDNDNYGITDEFCFLDCPMTLLNHFEQNKNDGNTYIIDLFQYDKMDIMVIKFIIQEIYKINPKSIIYIIKGNDFNFPNLPNVRFVDSVADTLL